LAAQEGHFARTVAALKDEARLTGGDRAGNNKKTWTLEYAWDFVHSDLQGKVTKGTRSLSDSKLKAFSKAVESGALADVQLYGCVGVDTKALRYGEEEGSALYWAAYHDRLELVQYFVQSGHDMETGKYSGEWNTPTPLCVAVERGHFMVVRYLVEQGADKNKVNNCDWTPLMAACHHGRVEMAEYLVDQGCDLDHVDMNGDNALHLAAREGHVKVVEYLLKLGVDKDKTNDGMGTPLFLSAEHGHIGVVKCLVEQGADKDKAYEDGTTPFMQA
jgi:hypothetical protein